MKKITLLFLNLLLIIGIVYSVPQLDTQGRLRNATTGADITDTIDYNESYSDSTGGEFYSEKGTIDVGDGIWTFVSGLVNAINPITWYNSWSSGGYITKTIFLNDVSTGAVNVSAVPLSLISYISNDTKSFNGSPPGFYGTAVDVGRKLENDSDATLVDLVLTGNLTTLNEVQAGRFRFIDGNNDSYMKIADSDWIGSENTIIVGNNEPALSQGDIVFLIYAQENKTIMFGQFGKNHSAGYLGNSWVVMPNSLSVDFNNNLTKLSGCLELCDWFNKTCPLSCDTSGYGASVMVQGGLHIWRELFVDEKSQFNDAINIFSQGDDVNLINASFHLRKERIEEIGLALSEFFNPLDENFDDGTLDPFVKIDQVGADSANWLVVSDTQCFDDQCARAEGADANNVRTMETNVSLLNTGECNLTFLYATEGLAGTDLFNVTINNNSGSGETTIFSTAAVVSNTSVNFILDGNYTNISKLTLRYRFNGQNVNRIVWVNDIVVRCNSTISTLQNVTRFDSEILGGGGDARIFYNDSSKSWSFIPENVSFGSVTQVSLNVTTDIETKNLTVTDTIIFGGQTITSFLDLFTGAYNLINFSADLATAGTYNRDNFTSDYGVQGYNGINFSSNLAASGPYDNSNFTTDFGTSGHWILGNFSDAYGNVMAWNEANDTANWNTQHSLSGWKRANATDANSGSWGSDNATASWATSYAVAGWDAGNNSLDIQNDTDVKFNSLNINDNFNVSTNGNVKGAGNLTLSQAGVQLRFEYNDSVKTYVIKVT